MSISVEINHNQLDVNGSKTVTFKHNIHSAIILDSQVIVLLEIPKGIYETDNVYSVSFDGEIVSYDEPYASETGSRERKDYGATTENIITDKGTEYSISFKGWLTNDEEPDKIGILVLVIKNQTLLSQNVDPEQCEVRIKVYTDN